MSEMCMLCDEVKEQEFISNIDKFKDYIAETKFDGERATIYIDKGQIIKIVRRSGVSALRQYPEFKDLRFDFDYAILDSEIIVQNGKEGGDFNEGLAFRSHLQDDTEILKRSKELPAKIMVFDILNLNGENLKFKSLIARKIKLRENLKDNEFIKIVDYSEDLLGSWNKAKQDNKEGLILKHKNSAYECVRSRYWLKLKNWKEMTIEFNSYETAISTKGGFYKGITLKNEQGDRCACMGKKSEDVKRILDECGNVFVVVQYLETTNEGRKRFISFKEIAK